MSITDRATWIIEGVHYRWLRPSFERAGIIFVLRPNVFVRDWRILKRFVSRKFGIMPTKKESVLDLYRLIEWNHKYDGENLKRAMDFIREFKHKVETCRLCRRSFEPCRGTLALERTFRMTGVEDFQSGGRSVYSRCALTDLPIGTDRSK